MRLKILILLITVLVLFIGWHLATSFIIAKAIAPPNTPIQSILAVMLHPRYQMATPHRSLFKEARLTIVPSVNAQTCGPPACNGQEAKAFCGDSNCETLCTTNYCQCPGCTQSGCTNYCCTATVTNSLCTAAFGKTPCQTCENDSSTTKCSPSGGT
jgi:hypothetical protein